MTTAALTDLQAVGGRVTYAYALVVNTELPAKNAAQLVKLSKASPSGLTYGSAGVGTGAHLVTELFQTETGGNFNHAPYKGVAPAQTDLVGGHIDFMFDTVGTAAPLVRAGKLHAIGVTSKSRTPAFPDVPAISESISGFQNVGWYALFAPNGVPKEAINRLNSEINKIYKDAEYRKFFESNDFTAATETPEELTAVVKEEFSLWGKVVDSAGIKKK